jgi:hypothetical protein
MGYIPGSQGWSAWFALHTCVTLHVANATDGFFGRLSGRLFAWLHVIRLCRRYLAAVSAMGVYTVGSAQACQMRSRHEVRATGPAANHDAQPHVMIL